MREPDPVDAHVGRRLGEARTIATRSRAAVAKAVGISAEQLRKYELAIDRVSASRLFALAQELKRPLDWFFSGLEAAPGVAEERATPDDGDVHARTRRLIAGFRELSEDTQNELLMRVEGRGEDI
ncbi:MAG: helix-turn-helix transcriptional regulator [Pseudomonadota bacterium]